jgi:hypothetical protein
VPRITYAPHPRAEARDSGEPDASRPTLTLSDAHHTALCDLMGGDSGALDRRHLDELTRLSRGEFPTKRLVNLVRVIHAHGAVSVHTVKR